MLLQLTISLPLFLLPLIFIFIFAKSKKQSTIDDGVPKSYPIIGSIIPLLKNRDNLTRWTASVLQRSPSATFYFYVPGFHQVMTANPANVQHILKTRFDNYPKGDVFRHALQDFLGNGIFNADGQTWKFQRQVASHEFNTKSLRKFVETVVDTELNERLIPLFADAAKNNRVLDLQDILQRFAFDNICKIAFGFDPECLLPSLPKSEFAEAFDYCVMVCTERLRGLFPIIWKVKRLLNVGDERRLRVAAKKVNDYAKHMVREKSKELKEKNSIESMDLLSRFLTSGHSDEDFVTDVVISFIVAGRDTTSAALTWFFWQVYTNPHVEKEILTEIGEKSGMPIYEEVKDMVYTHAALCETMRLYPPVPVDSKDAQNDDVWPDGTIIKKGYRAMFNIYAMGRIEMLWGSDWAAYKPERWLKKAENENGGENKKWNFVARDQYTYPVFQAGPRVCLGREMAFLQMKRVVAGVLNRFKVVPAFKEGDGPEFFGLLTTKMKNGFPVRIEERTH
ncbi:cytochrome P450 94A2-like [Rutidosis leptorrhynchoides]|uniref:cytochrome P450 94A2-like n=1 Tax=Rutidosis leptorrhynchoides TaxID=125765 RepID=UPI003A99D4E1